MKTVKGIIKAAERDSTGRLHIRFGGLLHTYKIWCERDTNLIRHIVDHWNDNSGLLVEFGSPSKIIITFNEITGEVADVFDVE